MPVRRRPALAVARPPARDHIPSPPTARLRTRTGLAVALVTLLTGAFAGAFPTLVLGPFQPGVAHAAVDDPGPVLPRPFPPGYGPDPTSCFSPLRVPAQTLPGPAGADGQPAPPAQPVYLILNVAARLLYVYQDGNLAAVYPTAVGRADHHTPIGDYSVLSKALYPTWYPPDGRPPIPPGPENPLGSRWIGWSWSGFGLHGTNAEWSIGHAVSLGCVRMRNTDVESLFELVRVGTPLRVVYEPVEVASVPEWGGRFVLTLHPDVYDRLGDYAAFLSARLEQAGCAVSPEVVAWLISALPRYQAVTFDTASPVLIGSRPDDTAVLRLGRPPDDVPLVAVRSFASLLGLSVGWDATAGQATLDGVAVPGVVVAGRSYARLDDLAAASGLHLDWTWETTPPVGGLITHRLVIVPGLVYVDGLLVSKQAFRETDGTYVPLRAVAQVLGFPVAWDPSSGVVTLRGVPVPVRISEGSSFIRTEDLAAYLAGLIDLVVTPDGVFVTGRVG